jgi:hypothetical protein
MLRYEDSMSEAWAYILKQRQYAAVACNILTYKLIQCGGFSRLTVACYRAETCCNSKTKCDFSDISGNFNVIVMTF